MSDSRKPLFDQGRIGTDQPRGIERVITGYQSTEVQRDATELLGALVQKDQYVGEVYSLAYETALVQIHDSHRKAVGGIPSLSFLVASRIVPGESFDYRQEDSSVLLLRVMDAAPLPNDDEAIRVRVDAARQVAGPNEGNWDDATIMDFHTAKLLSFAGVRCRVIGTFYLEPAEPTDEASLRLKFGADISNYYPNRGLKVYRPNAGALKQIVNYREGLEGGVMIGDVRYASTRRAFQSISDVPVSILAADLLGQKSALFGMTRTGKSNTTKIIAKAVFDLRYGGAQPRRVGQIIFDPNGEYANANAQDAGGEAPNALKNVWRADPAGKSDDVVTYGILSHPNDPHRKFMLLNFLSTENLTVGKDIIDAVLPQSDSKYIQNFQQVRFSPPQPDDYEGGEKSNEYHAAKTRYDRLVLAYRALLVKAGMAAPKSLRPKAKGLFNKGLREALAGSEDPEYVSASETLGQDYPAWSSLGIAFEALHKFMRSDAYKQFENNYIQKSSSGDPWAGGDFRAVLEMIARPNGAQLIGQAAPQHTDNTKGDYADAIYKELTEGRLVIIDQSSGDEFVNQAAARRIVQRIFDGNKAAFRDGRPQEDIPDILIYAEEAHNLLPSDRDVDYRDIWVRTAKEGAKYNLGMVYVTQEVSSIQKNILKNTSNWFIGHLNNTDELRELRKFYDFADFEHSILRAQDKGFLRVKTISNPFVVPVQVREFQLRLVQPEAPTSASESHG